MRYKKVCHPHEWQITTNKAKVIGIAVACLGALFSIPYVILTGRHTKTTPRSDIIAYECTTDDEFVNSNYPLASYMFFLLLYIAASLSITVLYILLGRKAWKHSIARHNEPPISTAYTISKSASKSREQPWDGSQNNTTRLGINNNVNVRKSITGETASCVEDIKMNQFHVTDEDNDASIQYGIRIFTDRIEIRTPMVGEFFVKLEKTKPYVVGIPSHDSTTFNTKNRNTVQQANDCAAGARCGDNKVVKANTSDGDTESVQSSLGNNDSNEKYTERRTLNAGNKSQAAMTNYEINANLNTDFHSKECLEETGLVYQCHSNVLNLYNGVDNNGHYPQSIQPAVNEALDESDPLSMFKWLDVVYCSEDEHTTCDSNCVEREAGLSFRLTLNNSLLQHTAWLRNSVTEAMARQGDYAAGSSVDRDYVQAQSVDISSSQNKVSEAYPGSRKGARFLSQLTKSLSRNQFCETVATRMSLPKSVSRCFRNNGRSTSRITIMLIIISAIYILDYLPHLGLMITKLLFPDVMANMSTAGSTVYNLFLRTYYINCAANPIVYSLCDGRFRRECFKFCKC